MTRSLVSRRNFLKTVGAIAGMSWLYGARPLYGQMAAQDATDSKADYTLKIATTPLELSPNRIVSVTTYNGQFPGPLLRMKEGQRVTIDVHNETDVPEQLHWHGQYVGTDVDGATEEGTPFIAPHGSKRISFAPGPSGLRFYHTHVRAGADLAVGQYSGLVGPVYIEPKENPGRYDREGFPRAYWFSLIAGALILGKLLDKMGLLVVLVAFGIPASDFGGHGNGGARLLPQGSPFSHCSFSKAQPRVWCI